MLRDLNSILDYIDRLNELDTCNVPPMAQVSDRYGVDERSKEANGLPMRAVKMCSKVCANLPADEALANAPDADGSSSGCRK